MSTRPLDAAVAAGDDPARHARVLAEVRQAVLTGDRPPARPRPVIEASWRRLLAKGVDPERGRQIRPLSTEEVERRRRSTRLADALPTLRAGLLRVADDAEHLMVVADAEGWLLWREGNTAVKLLSDAVGVAEGALVHEDAIGTNGIGTPLITRRPLQVYSAEHYVRLHHNLTCSGAPIHDPRTGGLLGVVNLSARARTVHPSSLALVDAVSRLAEAALRQDHRMELERLRAVAAPLLVRVAGTALAVDRDGWVAASTTADAPDRITLPASPDAAEAWLPKMGVCRFEPLPGGWLVRVAGEEAGRPTRVVLDLSGARPDTVEVLGTGGSWAYELSPRHAQILGVLARNPEGRSAAQLAEDLFGDSARTVTVRAEMSRLRRRLAGVLDRQPYRFAERVEVELRLPGARTGPQPSSTAPAIVAKRP
ncbi:GAF domain-containing protein [Allonocardiopsis opalescens]|uniref:GAF domain-containing protein n=1 Tax=Allonocardiopsis opalescens TaxID=1144618 RepID=A0A2T0QAT7_9ACTN|nr:helix-turn-helix domain-containing protein [Allonocardiopsis opalescens]PRY00957.1 GAF domain-containing protein [Allonocardiopsis opalescens]